MCRRWVVLRDDADGITAIEYGLMSAVLTLAIFAGVTIVGTNLIDVLTKVASFIVTSPKMP